MNKRSLSSLALVLSHVAASRAQSVINVESGPGGNVYKGVSESGAFILRTDGTSYWSTDNGMYYASYPGYESALGTSNVRRSAFGMTDPSSGLPFQRAFVDDGMGGSYPLTLGSSDEYLGVAPNLVISRGNGRILFNAVDPSTFDIKVGTDTGVGAATYFYDFSGAIGAGGLTVQSVSDTHAAGVALNGVGDRQTWFAEGLNFYGVDIGPGWSVDQLMVSYDGGTSKYLTLIADNGSTTEGRAFKINPGGVLTDTGLVIPGATRTAQANDGYGAFWTGTWFEEANLLTGYHGLVTTTNGDPLTGVSEVWTGSTYRLNGDFGSGYFTAEAVPEPASIAAIGLGVAALSRRRRGGRSQ